MRNVSLSLVVLSSLALVAVAVGAAGCGKSSSTDAAGGDEPTAEAAPPQPTEPRPPGGTWQSSAPMPFAIHNARLVELRDGRLFVFGSSTEKRGALYDPKTHTWQESAPSSVPRGDCAMTVLKDGRVLVTGGVNGDKQFYVLQGASLYDPKTNQWADADSMKEQRHGHAQFLLDDGRVIVFGGRPGGFAPPIRLIETYDPATDKWSTKGTLAAGRAFHAAARIDSKRFLLLGGQDKDGPLQSAEICTLGETRCEIIPLPAKRDSTALAQLADGRILVVDGQEPGARMPPVVVYDPASGRFDPTHRMVVNRNAHSATVMADGRVLVAGGMGGPMTQQAEIYDPLVGEWVKAGQPANIRYGHQAQRLGDGSIVLVGGSGADDKPVLAVDRFVAKK